MSDYNFEDSFKAISRSQAVIEFDMNGKILTANENFLSLMGYHLENIQGRHHSIFCRTEEVESEEYKEFWAKLRAGQFLSGEFHRLNSSGEDVFINGNYNPVFDKTGMPYKIIKFANDVTEIKKDCLDKTGKIDAINRSQAVIEFSLDGKVITANKNFLRLTGYEIEEIRGRHHRMFVEPEHAASAEYQAFWERLSRGDFEAGEYKRVGRGGKEVWIQATYNPIFDPAGRPVKIVKFATDITEVKLEGAEYRAKVDAINKGQAVIEFDIDGKVITANRKFLAAMGYTLREIQGQHHSIFCTSEYIQSEEYREFWLMLNEGKFISGRFHRMGKFDRDVWIQATYSPIIDLNGKVVKVVKYAYDVTKEVILERLIESRSKEMTVSIKTLVNAISEIAENSGIAENMAQESASVANKGYEAVNRSIQAINRIQASSKKVEEIVGLIGDIADQTNLLAFNAAIEAARAGEHGEGFSVVAGEVRKLAERSAEAAKEISKLISESAKEVEEGTHVSYSASKSFEGILSSVDRTRDSVSQIASSTKSQRDMANNVSTLIEKLAKRIID